MSSDLEYARLSYAGDLVVGLTFGIYVVLAIICIHFLARRRDTTLSHRIILGYTVTMLATGCIWFIAGAWFGELELVELPNIIGQFSSSTNELYTRLSLIKNTFFTINIFLADSLLAYRVFIIWGGSILVIVFPAVLWLAVVATGIAALVLTSRPDANFQASYVINLETAFFCLSISLNVVCTLLIAGRLLLQQRASKHLGSTGSSLARTYTYIIIVIVESAALYSIFGLIYIPLMVLQAPIQFPFSSLIGTLTLIAPNLIILRIALKSPAYPTTEKAATMLFRANGYGEHEFKARGAPVLCTTESSGTSQDARQLTDSDVYDLGASTGIIDVGEGNSSERLVKNREKVMV